MRRFRLILDANFLLLPFQFNLNMFEEFERLFANPEVYTLEETVDEATSVEDGKYSSLVKKLIEKKQIELIETGTEQGKKKVDELLLEFGQKGFVICTNDNELKKKLDQLDLPIVYLRNKGYLEAKNLEGYKI